MDKHPTRTRAVLALAVTLVLVASVSVACATPRMPAETMPACATEDAAGPCYWDAATQGNGAGSSFYVDDAQAVHYLAVSR